MNSAKVGCVLMGLALAGAAGAASLSDVTPWYHYAFDGSCANDSAAGDQTYVLNQETSTAESDYYATKTGGKAMAISSSFHPHAYPVKAVDADYLSVLVSVRSCARANSTILSIGDNTNYALVLATEAPNVVKLVNNESATFCDKIAYTNDSVCTAFHTYAIVYSKSAQTAKFYADGTYLGTASDFRMNGVNNTSWNALQIGGIYGNGNESIRAIGALVDDVRIYGAELTDDQIKEYATAFPVQGTAETTTWTNGSEDGKWATADNWSNGVPSTKSTAVFESDATVVMPENTTARNFDTLDIGANRVAFRSTSSWPRINPICVTGSGTLVLQAKSGSACGLETQSSLDQIVLPNVSIESVDDADVDQDVFIQGNSAKQYFFGDVTVSSHVKLCDYGNSVFMGALTINSKKVNELRATNSVKGMFNLNGWIYTNNGGTTDISGTLNLAEDTLTSFDANTTVSGTIRLDTGVKPLSNIGTSIAAVELGTNAILKLPADVTIAKVDLKKGATLIFDESSYTSGETISSIATITDLAAEEDASWTVCKFGTRVAPSSLARDADTGVLSGVLTDVDENTCITNYWCNDSPKSWLDSDFTGGALKTCDVARVNRNLKVTEVNSDVVVGDLEIAEGKELYLLAKSGKYSALRVITARGGTIRLSQNGLKPVTGCGSASVYSDVVLDDEIAGGNQDCWIEGNSTDEPLNVYGNIYARECELRVNQGMNLYGKIYFGYTGNDASYFNKSTVKNGGELVVENSGNVTVYAGSKVENGGKITSNAGGIARLNGGITIGGALGGAGGEIKLLAGATLSSTSKIVEKPFINITGGSGDVWLYGDNSNFAGVVTNGTYNQVVHFENANAGSAKAGWYLCGDVKSNLSEGVLKFGSLDLEDAGTWHFFYINQNATTNLVLEVGALGKDMHIGTASAAYYFGTLNETTGNTKANSACLLRKVGAGTLHMYLKQYDNIEAKEGVVEFMNIEGPSKKYYFNGGTFKFPSTYTWDPTSRFESLGGACIIDTGANWFRWGNAGFLAHGNGLVKKGSGTLYLYTAPSEPGNITVEAGTLVLPPEATDVGKLTVAKGATVSLIETDKTMTTGTGVSLLSATGLDLADGATFTINGNRMVIANVTYSSESSAIVADVSEPTEGLTVNWIGPYDGGYQDEKRYWSPGLPTSADTVNINYDTVILHYASGSSYCIYCAEMKLNNCHLTFRMRNRADTAAIITKKLTGAGTLTLQRAGLEITQATEPVEVPDTIKIDTIDVGGGFDSWLSGSKAGPVTFKGEVCATGKLNVYAYVNLKKLTGDGLVNYEGEHTEIKPDVSEFTGSFMNGNWLAISGDVDLSGFSWTASENDIHFRTASTYKFGALHLPKMDGYNKMLYFDSTDASTLEVGALNTDFAFYDGFFVGYQWGETAPKANVTLVKKGTGTLDYYCYGIPAIRVDEGELKLNTPVCHDKNAILVVDDITVKSGATLSGEMGSPITLSNVAFEDGALLKQYLAYDTELTGVEFTNVVDDVTNIVAEVQTNGLKFASTLALTSAVNVGGVTCVVGNTNLLVAAKSNMTSPIASGCTFNFLTTTGTLSGTPVTETTTWVDPAKEKPGYQPAGSDSCWGWVAKAHPDATTPCVSLDCWKYQGFLLIIR